MPKSTNVKKATCANADAKHKMNSTLPAAHGKVLNVLAARKVKVGENEVDKRKLAGYAGIGGSTMRKAVANLVGHKYVIQTREHVRITSLGMDNADPDAIDVPTTNDQKHAQVKQTLNEKQCALFDALIDGKIHDKSTVAAAVGMDPKISTWRKLVGGLAKDDIVEHQGNTIRLHKDMFPIVPRPED
jgi:hypothetical protein